MPERQALSPGHESPTPDPRIQGLEFALARDAWIKMLSSVLFLFLSHLAIGIAFTLLLVRQTAGVKFFRFNAGLGVVLMLVALAFRPAGLTMGGDVRGVSAAALMAATAALVVYWATVGRALAAVRPALLWAAAICGAAALVGDALAAAPVGPLLAAPLTIASFFTSAALLGGASTAMILGHWYLVLPSMDVSLLQSVVKFHIASTFLRIVIVGAAVWFAIASWQLPSGVRFERYILSIDGVFFWQRVLFGLAAPVVLAYLTWETAKIRATQSATGILYVDFFTVMVGEVLAKYLLLATKVPV